MRQGLAETLQELRFAQVIRLFPQLGPHVHQQRFDIELPGQQAGHAQQARHVIDITIDAVCHTRILDLEYCLAPVGCANPVYLPDGCRRQRLPLEIVQGGVPALAVGTLQRGFELLARHGIRIGA